MADLLLVVSISNTKAPHWFTFQKIYWMGYIVDSQTISAIITGI